MDMAVVSLPLVWASMRIRDICGIVILSPRWSNKGRRYFLIALELWQSNTLWLQLIDHTGRSISSGHRPNEDEEAKFIEWDDLVQVRSFRPRFETSPLFGWERQKQISILELDFFRKSRCLGELPSKCGDIVR
jgi:hypothetical protein